MMVLSVMMAVLVNRRIGGLEMIDFDNSPGGHVNRRIGGLEINPPCLVRQPEVNRRIGGLETVPAFYFLP